MSDTATISFRTDPTIKREAKELYADMGMDLSTAINIFLRQSIRENGMPFKITRENPINAEARRQAENHEGSAGCLNRFFAQRNSKKISKLCLKNITIPTSLDKPSTRSWLKTDSCSAQNTAIIN